jgi:hypothetical protein
MMLTHRFGRKLKLPSTVQIKHEILLMMLQEALERERVAPTKDDDHSVRPSI